ncbi:MAG: hypothetical protein OIN87_04610 [Candidatus Methanoperedens sp.]|nr:hypothetical protein [Candidatus Methanoperedens sp.]
MIATNDETMQEKLRKYRGRMAEKIEHDAKALGL